MDKAKQELNKKRIKTYINSYVHIFAMVENIFKHCFVFKMTEISKSQSQFCTVDKTKMEINNNKNNNDIYME